MPAWLLPTLAGGCVGLVMAFWVAKRALLFVASLIAGWIWSTL